MEILILPLIPIIKWPESQSPIRRLLISVIYEAHLLLIICSISLNVSQSGDIQVWRYIFLCGSMALTVTDFLQVAKSH